MNPNANSYGAADPQGSAAQNSPLQRGKACLPCRRRKVKCDSIRPICTPCLRSERLEDCEYTDGQRRPRTLTLEEDIARLRARVQELENPQDAIPSVQLHVPYADASASSSGTSSSSASMERARSQGPPSGSYHHATEMMSRGLSGGGATEPRQMDIDVDVQLHARRALSVIAPHAAGLGVFLNLDRLRIQGTQVLPALKSVLTLWSILITSASNSDDSEAYQRGQTLCTAVLSKAQTQLTSALSTVDAEPDPAIFLHVIQTGVLLAYYMQRIGQVVGAKYYASGTWALVMMLKLYRRPHMSTGTREGEDQTSQQGGAREESTHESTNMCASLAMRSVPWFPRLPPALDGIEAEERVRAFWAAYMLDRWFSVAFESPCGSLVMDGSARNVMTVPWPGVGGVVETRSNVVQHFLDDPNHDFAREGALAMYAKASVLLGEATRIAASSVNDQATTQTAAFRTRFGTLDALLQRCLSAAMAIATASRGHQSLTQEQTQAVITIHLTALAHATLHRPFISTYGPSRRRSVEGAFGVVHVLDQLGDVVVRTGGISPIFAIIWTSLCLTLNEELRRLRARPDGDASRRREEAELTAAIRKLLGVLSSLSHQGPSRFFAANIDALLPVLGSMTV